MHQGGGMQDFNGGTQRDQFLFRCPEHISNKQAHRRTDPFAAGCQQMLQRRTKVGMMFLTCLFTDAFFDQEELFLNTRKKSDRTQLQPPQPKRRAAFSDVMSATCSGVVIWISAILSAIYLTKAGSFRLPR